MLRHLKTIFLIEKRTARQYFAGQNILLKKLSIKFVAKIFSIHKVRLMQMAVALSNEFERHLNN